jgi:HK97 family phage prohead protease
MERLILRSEFRELKDTSFAPYGGFEGHAAVVGNVDLGGDRIEPGAFKKTIKYLGGEIKVLAFHDDRSVPVGMAKVSEDSKGLAVRAAFHNTPFAQEIRQSMVPLPGFSRPALDAMSFAYDASKWHMDNGVRVLKELKLYEVSVVNYGMNPEALVTSAKSRDEIVELRAELQELKSYLYREGLIADGAGNPLGDSENPDGHGPEDTERDEVALVRSFADELKVYALRKEAKQWI